MRDRSDREGLSIAYRIGWRIRYLGWHLFGPAELSGDQDPHERLRRERQARLAAARRARDEKVRGSRSS